MKIFLQFKKIIPKMLKEEPIGYYYNQFEEVLNKLTFEKDSKFTYLSKLENVFAIFAIIDLFCSTIIFKILYNKIDQFLFLKNLGEVKKKKEKKKLIIFLPQKKKKSKKKLLQLGLFVILVARLLNGVVGIVSVKNRKINGLNFFIFLSLLNMVFDGVVGLASYLVFRIVLVLLSVKLRSIFKNYYEWYTPSDQFELTLKYDKWSVNPEEDI